MSRSEKNAVLAWLRGAKEVPASQAGKFRECNRRFHQHVQMLGARIARKERMK